MARIRLNLRSLSIPAKIAKTRQIATARQPPVRVFSFSSSTQRTPSNTRPENALFSSGIDDHPLAHPVRGYAETAVKC